MLRAGHRKGEQPGWKGESRFPSSRGARCATLGLGVSAHYGLVAAMPPGQRSIEAHSVLVFELGDPPRRFALPLSQVREVIRAVAMVPLPGASPIVEGIIDVRGEIVPVLDIRARFGLPPARLASTQRLVLARARARGVALRVDQVAGLERVPVDRWTDRVEISGGTRRIAGVGRLTDGLVLLHDLDTFLDEEEVASLAGAVDAYQRPRS